ncbi:hypothetical protein [Methylobacterium sp. CM6247]
MAKKIKDRTSFRKWVDGITSPDWSLMPLTHVTKGINLADIMDDGEIQGDYCDNLKDYLNFFSYGRPGYRISGDGVIKAEVACPTCLIFKPELIQDAEKFHAFDTGAFGKRMFSHILVDEMNIDDFSLQKDVTRPNKIISAVFKSKLNYFNADTSKALKSDEEGEAWQFHTKAYLDLINSKGRNEPDDRVCSIEIVIKNAVKLEGKLLAIAVPHTFWNETKQAPWLLESHGLGVTILPYEFIPGKHPDHYHSLLEGVIRDYYKSSGVFDE